jgi:hypothetical protein
VQGKSPPTTPSPLPPLEHKGKDKGRGKDKERDGPEHVQHGHPTKPLAELVEELAAANRNLVTPQPPLTPEPLFSKTIIVRDRSNATSMCEGYSATTKPWQGCVSRTSRWWMG